MIARPDSVTQKHKGPDIGAGAFLLSRISPNAPARPRRRPISHADPPLTRAFTARAAGALEHVLGWVGLDHPDRIALGRVDVDLERHTGCIEKLHGAAAILVDRIRAVGARGGLKYVPAVAERIGDGNPWRAQRTVAVELENFNDRLGNPGRARRTGWGPRKSGSVEDVLPFQDVVIAFFRLVGCGQPREAQSAGWWLRTWP